MFKIENINVLINYNLNSLNEECPICRNSLFSSCITCENDKSIECISVIGCCNHGIHKHCIDNWIKTRNVCPLDNTPWKLLTKDKIIKE